MVYMRVIGCVFHWSQHYRNKLLWISGADDCQMTHKAVVVDNDSGAFVMRATADARSAPRPQDGRRRAPDGKTTSRYTHPDNTCTATLNGLLTAVGRPRLEARQLDMLGSSDGSDVSLFYVGSLDILRRPAVSIVGTREVSPDGVSRARKLARELSDAGVLIVSGLARGVDTEALTSAIDAGGSVAAVIGTPLDKAYPAENAKLQEAIYTDHLLISPFAEGDQVFRSNFPKRNRVMAALSDATVIVEASDTSGTLHQAAECQRLRRWLFIMRSVAENTTLRWPRDFIGKPHVAVLSKTADILDAIKRRP